MKEILFVNACIRGEHSRTRQIAEAYLEALKEKGPVQIKERDLTKEQMGHLVHADFDPQTGERDELKDAFWAEELAAADEIVVAAPFWEFSFPAALSCYLEKTSVAGVTFCYTPEGSKGLCRAKFLTYIYTAGAFIPEEDEIGRMLLQRLAALYGIPVVDVIRAQGLDLDDADLSGIMASAVQEAKEKAGRR